jgi:hypothetical protein
MKRILSLLAARSVYAPGGTPKPIRERIQRVLKAV